MAKKFLSILTLILASAGALILLLILFGVFGFKGLILNILLTVATLTGVFLLLLNSIFLIKRKKVVAIISFLFVIISAILLLGYFWFLNDIIITLFARVALSSALFAVLFNIISTSIIKLGKKLVSVQLSAYAIFITTTAALAGFVWGINIFASELLSKLFCVLVLLSLIFLAVILVLSKKQFNSRYIR